MHLVGIAIPTLRELRTAVISSSTPEAAVAALREAGYAGGEAVHAAFERWVGERGGAYDAGELTLDEFGSGASEFFRDAGWGNVDFSHDEDEGVAIVDITGCWEAGDGNAGSDTGCHITTGLLAAFFGRIAGYPVAVLETECCHGDGSRCRFVMGNAEIMNHKWHQLRTVAENS